MTLEAGTRLGPYEIVSPLGKGGMGEVYKARDTRLEREVAIKVLRAEWSEDPRFKERLEREAKKISQLQHPNVCTLHDVGSQDGVDYLVMEYLHGETVESRLNNKGPLPIPEVLKIGSQIAEAIEAAHRRGVVHRDLKPGNVILTASGAKVLDFGLARDAIPPGQAADTQAATFAAAITEEGSFVGTMPYMAPELLEGRAADARADIWALGCVLYEMATGERPFRGANRASLTTAIMSGEPEPVSRKRSIAPERLDWVVKRCLAKDPERRWHSARDVSIELDAIAGQSMAASDSTPASAVAVTADGRSPTMANRPHVIAIAGAMAMGRGRGRSSRRRLLVDLRAESRQPLPSAGWDTAAALPFQTLSDDSETRQLAAGIPQEMSTRWARSGYTLLTPSSSAVSAADPCAAVPGLRVGVYHGSVGRFQSQVRVTAQLTACPEGNRLWGGTESYDAADLSAAQEKIARWILSTTHGHVYLNDPEGTLAGYERRITPADNARGLELAREAWRKDRSPEVGAERL